MSVTQATTQGKARTIRQQGLAWHRESTRKAILDAARDMIEREGLEKMSLLGLAERCGFAAPTVFAYFVRKADVVSAIVADDLAAFARSINEGFPFAEYPEEDETEEEIDSASNGTGAQYSSFAGADPVVDLHADSETSQGPSNAPDHSPIAGSTSATRDVGHAGAEVISALESLEARVSEIESRRVDPWLERRLREFEHMLAALDERVTATDKVPSGETIDGRFGTLAERLDGIEAKIAAAQESSGKALAEGIEGCEARLRESWAELRTLALETAGRIETLERDRERRALAAEMPAIDFANSKTPEEEAPAATESAEDEGADDSYLAAARRAAQTAQTLAQSEASPRRTRPMRARTSLRTQILMTACAGLAVVVLSANLLLSMRAKPHVVAHPHAVQTAKVLLPPSPALHATDFAGVSQAAAAGNTRAQLEIGLAYLNGVGVGEDDARAAHWLEAAAVSGDAVAQYWLATLYEHGRGEQADPAEAIRWYEAAALQGNLKAMYKLAVSYAEGWGTRQNYSEAARWFSRAAEMGFVNAQYNLGVLYERGLGVPQSLLDSYKWYAIAAAQGDKDSAARIDALSSQLSAEDLATARDAAAAYRPQVPSADSNAMPELPFARHAAALISTTK